MNSSAMAGWAKRSWIIVTRSASAARSWTTEAWAIPTEASLCSGFTMSGKRTSEAGAIFSPGR